MTADTSVNVYNYGSYSCTLFCGQTCAQNTPMQLFVLATTKLLSRETDSQVIASRSSRSVHNCGAIVLQSICTTTITGAEDMPYSQWSEPRRTNMRYNQRCRSVGCESSLDPYECRSPSRPPNVQPLQTSCLAQSSFSPIDALLHFAISALLLFSLKSLVES